MNSLLAQAAAGAPSAGLLANPMVFMILLFAIFYFIAIRPQQRREKERKAQIAALRAGQVILFCGGMVGVVEEVREKTERDFFLTAEEALEFGVIDEIFKPHKAVPDIKA